MVFFSDFSVSSATDFFFTSGVSVSCSGNAASKKGNLPGVNHTQKLCRELFTPKLIAFEPVRKRTGNRCTYYLDYISSNFQTRSHTEENGKSVSQKLEFSTKFLFACRTNRQGRRPVVIQHLRERG